jgi:hypothetical protein
MVFFLILVVDGGDAKFAFGDPQPRSSCSCRGCGTDRLNVRFMSVSFDGYRIRYINGKLMRSAAATSSVPASYSTLDTNFENYVDVVGFFDPASTDTLEVVFDINGNGVQIS